MCWMRGAATVVPLIIISYSRGVDGGELGRGIALVDTGRSRKSQVIGIQPPGLPVLHRLGRSGATEVLQGSSWAAFPRASAPNRPSSSTDPNCRRVHGIARTVTSLKPEACWEE